MKRSPSSSLLTLVMLLSATFAAPPRSPAQQPTAGPPLTSSVIVLRLSDDEVADPSSSDAATEAPASSGPLASVDDWTCAAAPRWRIGTDYLCWWVQGNPLPPLLTTSPAGTARNQAGVLGQAGTQVLLGDQRFDDGARQGGRLTIGYGLNDCDRTGIEFSFFGLGGDDTHEAAQSTGSPILARPFYDTSLPGDQALLIAYPRVVEGNIDVATTSELYSASALFRRNWKDGSLGRVDLLGGYRYFRFNEGLTITDHLVSTDPGGPLQIGTTLDLIDHFATQTDFHGGEVGLLSEFCRGSVSLSIVTKLAIGGVQQRVQVDGTTKVTTPSGQSLLRAGGLLTQPSNLGTQTNSDWALLPEVGAKLGYQLTPGLSVSAGYSLLYLTEVLRTADQIDTVINPAQPLGPARPAPLMHSTSLSAQGLNLGAELRF